jgi:hypothetical protein
MFNNAKPHTQCTGSVRLVERRILRIFKKEMIGVSMTAILHFAAITGTLRNQSQNCRDLRLGNEFFSCVH